MDNKKTQTLSPNDIQDVAPPTRRSALGALGALVAGAVAGSVALAPSAAHAQRTDSDPNDAAGRGTRTGRTDSDPNDAAGRGSRTGRVDSDPNDAAGRGTRTGRTDSDPSDGAGRGR